MTIVIVWMTLTGILLIFLIAINVIAEFRLLSKIGVLRPAYIIFQNTLGRLLPSNPEPIETLIGRTAFLSWDIRWVSADITMACISGICSNGNVLTLKLLKPILIYATDKVPEFFTDEMYFVPKEENLIYCRLPVSGELRPPIKEGLIATATLIIYPISK